MDWEKSQLKSTQPLYVDNSLNVKQKLMSPAGRRIKAPFVMFVSAITSGSSSANRS